jgi:PIN domain nuclease of toxin-antitoxin system
LEGSETDGEGHQGGKSRTSAEAGRYLTVPYVTDTHALIWHLVDPPQLSDRARRIFERTDRDEERIFIPCITFFELLYLTEKKKVPADFKTLTEMVASSENYRVEPLCLPVIERAREIPKATVPDPWDRLIAATSLHLGLPLITRDRRLREIGIEIIW